MSETGWDDDGIYKSPRGAKFDRPGKRMGDNGKQKANGHDHSKSNGHAHAESEETDPYADHRLPTVGWVDRRLSDWNEDELPDRLWVLPGWIPREQVTGLYGPPGVNKTDFLIHLMMALSVGLVFAGHQLVRMATFGLFCEDTDVEIARRAARIASHYGMWLSEFPDFHYASLVGYGPLEFVTFDGNTMYESNALKHFDSKISERGCGFACLDTAPHFFGGSEIDRRQVSRFLRRLDAISIVRNCGILITAHPSARGARAGGRMDSGSTGWEGGVRARIALTRPEQEAEEGKPPTDTKDRTLTLWKSNYAPPGQILDLICDHGVFTTSALDPEKAKARGPGRDAACEGRFLELLAAEAAKEVFVNMMANVPSTYAPAVFNSLTNNAFSIPEFTRAMKRLLGSGRISLQTYGPPSRRRQKFIITGAEQTQESEQNQPIDDNLVDTNETTMRGDLHP